MAELGLAIAGLAVGVPAVIKAISYMSDTILQRVKHYDGDYNELLSLIIRINKSQTQDLFLYFQSHGTEVPDDLQTELNLLFQALRSMFEELLMVFKDVGPEKTIRKVKLSSRDKEKAAAIMRRLEEWNDRFFKRALVFIFFGAKPLPDRYADLEDDVSLLALRRVEKLREAADDLLQSRKPAPKLLLDHPERPDERSALPNSALHLSLPAYASPTSGLWSLVEYRVYDKATGDREVQDQRRVVREIAAIMNQADTNIIGLLHCRGFLWDSISGRFEVHFTFPRNFGNPRSLLDILKDPSNRKGVKHPLDQRIHLARAIVSAVFVLHAADFVHKQIRPDNIILFEREPQTSVSPEISHQVPNPSATYPYKLGRPFLVGFDNVRKADAASLLTPTEDWQKSLYLSPERHRLRRGDEFRMQHDLFSLGVVLIEIAFWESFQDTRAAKLRGVIWQDDGMTRMRAPDDLKRRYLGLARGAVARVMGSRYADVVVACLTGLDVHPDDPSLQDQDGIIMGTAYITRVVRGLEEISM